MGLSDSSHGWRTVAQVAHRHAEYRLAGNRYREVPARLGAAVAQLQVLPLPPDVRAAVDAANNCIERLSQDRSPELQAEWSNVHARLMDAAQTLGVERSGRRPRRSKPGRR